MDRRSCSPYFKDLNALIIFWPNCDGLAPACEERDCEGQLVLEGMTRSSRIFGQYKSNAETFLCNYAQKGSGNFEMTAGGMLWFLPWETSSMLAQLPL
ncbi:hypothetical protein CRG98_020229 [Punica granatum]|uniref:Uncharacterized protein n=1 Tax=Punica granatum TaxID=22663 RepID=A0A2I0JSX3_PUNGR|nr:hypothetical protein CRG98_020229 [Punica granatum]